MPALGALVVRARRVLRRVRRRIRPTRVDRILAVHGWTLEEQIAYLMDRVRALPDASRIVELGVWQGRSALAMAEACRGTRKHVWAVDPWADYVQGGVEISTRLERWGVASFDEVYARFEGHRDRLGLAPWITPVRRTSVDAAREWRHGPVALVFLDGNHDYEAVSADLAAWLPHLAPGGALIGDDWNWDVVRRAVEDFAAAHPGWRIGRPRENTWELVAP